jgi:transposase
MFEADTMYVDFVGRDSFYAFLAAQRGELFRDEAFAELYAAGLGRPSVPPSLLATALVLQTYDGVSDREAARRASYDLQWKVALGVELTARPFQKSVLQEFRAQLVANEQPGAIFAASLELAKRTGFFPGDRKIKLALDTTNILGRGAVKDTYNLLADGIVQVLRVLAGQIDEEVVAWAEREGFARYVTGSSLKGEAELDWDDPAARRGFLAVIVADADRLLERVRVERGKLPEGSAADGQLAEAAGLLARILLQDVERQDDGPQLKKGVSKDRVPAVHDPEMRHGRKSKRKRFDGHKAQLAVDTDSQLITSAAVLPGNAPDREQALALVEATELTTGCVVEATLGDCAYGDGVTRAAFAKDGRPLIAKVPAVTNQGRFPKTQFRIELEQETCTCPAQQVSHDFRPAAPGGGVFHFAAAVCAACPLRSQCVRGTGGRTVQMHPQEGLLQAARAFQASPAFREYRARRQTVEHRIARLVQLGLRQARYRGRAKTLFQLLTAAAVANLTLIASSAASSDAPSVSLAPTALLGIVLLAAFWGLPASLSRSKPGPGLTAIVTALILDRAFAIPKTAPLRASF